MPELVTAIECARANGRQADAESLCRVAINMAPHNASLRVWLGWIAMDRKAYAEAVAAARQAAALNQGNAVDIARLLVYSAALSGNWALANETLCDLGRLDESAAQAIAAEAAPAFLACLNELQRNNAFTNAVAIFKNVPGVLGAAAPTVMRRIRAAASSCYLALDQAEAAIAIFGGTAAGPLPVGSSQSGGSPPLLVTSLMPARIDLQRAAIASWRRLGFSVASVNAGDEIDLLQPEFEGVRFHVACRDAREQVGRPLVYVDDMLGILAKGSSKIAGIINADIVFSDDAGDVLAEASSLANDALLFGHRTDIASLDEASHPSAELLPFGYDWFLFRTDQALRLAGAGMVFGAPWWDIWLPLRAKSLGLDIVNVRRSIALHEDHDTRWNQRDMEMMGWVLTRTLIADARETLPVTRFQRRMIQLAAVLSRMEPEAFADRHNLDWLASLLRGLIQLDAMPFGAVRLPLTNPFWNSLGQI